jgi:hypothetical protein
VLCNRIVTTMGGLMEIQSEVGLGSVFTAYVDLEILDVRTSSSLYGSVFTGRALTL